MIDAVVIGAGQSGLAAAHALSYLEPTERDHRKGISTVHPGLGYVGLEWQRSFASATHRSTAQPRSSGTSRFGAGRPSAGGRSAPERTRSSPILRASHR